MLRIDIETDNAAFEEYAGTELARILRFAADKIEGYQLSDYPMLVLRDINGNSCGVLTLTEE
jgi:hypothetical protein